MHSTSKVRVGAWTALFVALLGFAGVAGAQVYRWTDAQGVVHYSDKPHRQGAKPASLPKLQTYQPDIPASAMSAATETSAASSAAPGKTALVSPPRIIQPKDGATIRDAQSRVPVSVSVALGPGQGLIYFVDHKPRNRQPTTNPARVLTQVWRGTHHISVAVVDGDGKIVSRSKPVTVYMKQPTVHHPH